MKFFICLGIAIVLFLVFTMVLTIYSGRKMNKVTLDDCVLMDKCYGKKAIINDGSVLGFKKE